MRKYEMLNKKHKKSREVHTCYIHSVKSNMEKNYHSVKPQWNRVKIDAMEIWKPKKIELVLKHIPST